MNRSRQPSKSPDDSPRSPPRRPARWLHLPARRDRTVLFVAIYLVFCGGLVWGAARVYWRLTAAVPLNESPTVWDFYYPRIRESGLAGRQVSRTDRRFDLLLLGGSVLEPGWGAVQKVLESRLERLIPGQWAVYNLSRSAFTSRDSLLQYEHLDSQKFDLVIVYDGINDIRMNACRPELFRDDYSHCAWYNGFARRLAAGSISLPEATFERLQAAVEVIPLGTPDAHLVDFGGEPQTPRTLRANLEAIARIARERGDPLLLQTYAYYVPENYTAERMLAGELDYSSSVVARCALELWGRPTNVLRTLELQNTAVRELAREHPEVHFIDQHDLLPKAGDNFIDPCHLSGPGSERFVENLWPEIDRAIRASPVWNDTSATATD